MEKKSPKKSTRTSSTNSRYGFASTPLRLYLRHINQQQSRSSWPHTLPRLESILACNSRGFISQRHKLRLQFRREAEVARTKDTLVTFVEHVGHR